MQQQQDRHQNILSQIKRLLSHHHHHHHHLSNAQHLQILSNLMKTLCKAFLLMKSHRQDKKNKRKRKKQKNTMSQEQVSHAPLRPLLQTDEEEGKELGFGGGEGENRTTPTSMEFQKIAPFLRPFPSAYSLPTVDVSSGRRPHVSSFVASMMSCDLEFSGFVTRCEFPSIDDSKRPRRPCQSLMRAKGDDSGLLLQSSCLGRNTSRI